MILFIVYFLFQLELLAAKNLIGANLNGTSDPYAIITCGSEKRFRLFDLFSTLNFINLSWILKHISKFIIVHLGLNTNMVLGMAMVDFHGSSNLIVMSELFLAHVDIKNEIKIILGICVVIVINFLT
jgi:hypothetical protein